MKKLAVVLFAVALVLGSVGVSDALLLLSEDFTGGTIHDNLTIDLTDNPPSGANDNLGKWIDFPNTFRWGISDNGQSGSGDYYAQHLVQTSDNTNLLFYGIDLSPYPALTEVTLEFDYIASNRKPKIAIAGLLNGQHKLDPYGGWFSGDPAGDDGVILYEAQIDKQASWYIDKQITVPVSQDFDVLALGFIMGGIEGSRGIDNVEVNATPVPEPATILLIGTGLVGFGVFRKKFKK